MIILAIDQAACSGWALGFLDGVRITGVSVGIATTPAHRAGVVKAALAAAGDPRELYVVFEDHSEVPAGKGRSTETVLGMGAAKGWWQERLRIEGHPQSHCFKVTPREWRREVLGFTKHVKAEVAKETAVIWARATLREHDVPEDAAEALGILHWAARNIPVQLETQREQRRLLKARAS